MGSSKPPPPPLPPPPHTHTLVGNFRYILRKLLLEHRCLFRDPFPKAGGPSTPHPPPCGNLWILSCFFPRWDNYKGIRHNYQNYSFTPPLKDRKNVLLHPHIFLVIQATVNPFTARDQKPQCLDLERVQISYDICTVQR